MANIQSKDWYVILPFGHWAGEDVAPVESGTFLGAREPFPAAIVSKICIHVSINPRVCMEKKKKKKEEAWIDVRGTQILVPRSLRAFPEQDQGAVAM